MVDPQFYMLGQPSFWLGLAFVLALAVIPLWIGWRALDGTYRRWTIAPPIPFQISSRNTWPFVLLSAGITIAVALPTIVFEVIGWEDARQFVWAGPVWIPLAGLILSVFYWPVTLAPRWYREWVRHPHYPDVSPWSPDEVEAVLAMPESRKRNGMLKDMEWCGVDVDAAWTESGLPGRPPQEWWEKKVDKISADNAAMGITDDMDVFEKATIIRQHREQEKAAKKAARQARRSD
jgi:hypothetical protein